MASVSGLRPILWGPLLMALGVVSGCKTQLGINITDDFCIVYSWASVNGTPLEPCEEAVTAACATPTDVDNLGSLEGYCDGSRAPLAGASRSSL